MVRRAGQHEGPWEIPLELFLGRVADLKSECDRILVVGTSFGAEAALLTGAHSSLVAAVVAFAPSDVVWAGVTADGRATSHWTLGGQPLAHVPFLDDWQPAQEPPAFVDFYRAFREAFPECLTGAEIPVERIPEVVLVGPAARARGMGSDQRPTLTHRRDGSARLADMRMTAGLG